MAAKVISLLALFAVAAFAAENDCNCEPPNETEDKALWDFLKKLSSDLTDAEDKEMRAVLPGVLSPLLECNCLEKNRRKRKIMPEEESESSENVTSEESSEENNSVREKKSIHFKTKRCPHGTVWIGIMCVPEEYLD